MEDALGLENKLSRQGLYFVTELDDPDGSIPVASGGTGFVSTSPLIVIDVASTSTLSVVPLEIVLNQVTSGTGSFLWVKVIGDGGSRRNAAGSGTQLTSHGPNLGAADPTSIAEIYVGSAVTISAVDPRPLASGVYAVGEGVPVVINFNAEAIAGGHAAGVSGGRSILVYAWTPGGGGTQVAPTIRHAEVKR